MVQKQEVLGNFLKKLKNCYLCTKFIETWLVSCLDCCMKGEGYINMCLGTKPPSGDVGGQCPPK